jgi:flagellar hook-associated protein 1 FlgK
MSLSSIFGSGLSGLQAAQAGLRVVSQNIANVNTPGYARADIDLQATQLGSQGGGVAVVNYHRAVDQFLSAAALNAQAGQGAGDVRADLLGRAQQAFGDPTSDSSLFAALDKVFTRFTELSADPTNTLRRTNVTTAIQDFLSSISNVGQQIESLRVETEDRLNEQAQTASNLLSRISDFNVQIRNVRANGGDSTSVENAQAQLIDQLSSYMDVTVSNLDTGGVSVRTGAGALLVGETPAQIRYTPASTAYSGSGSLDLIDANGAAHPLEGLIRSGSIFGLMQARDVDLPGLSEALGSLAGAAADALNAAHNESTTVPAPTSLTGRDTGLLATDRLGFTGASVIGVTDANGNLLHTVKLDFSNGTYSLDGAAAVSYGGANATVTQLVSGLNTALSGIGGASFANGKLTISGSGGNGVVVQQDPTTPSSRGGRGFSQFFGLNDLVTRDQPIFFDTGFAGTDAHGLDSGGALSFQVRDASGRVVLTRTVAVTGTTWNDEIGALNSASTGLGGYGSFGLDANGKLTASPASGYSIEVTADTTVRGASGLSMSQLFGLDRHASAGRASELQLAAAIAADPSRLSIAQPDLTAPLNSRVLEAGDTRGASALAAAGATTLTFAAAGVLPGQTATLATYASRLGGEAGRRAEDAATAQESATSVATAAKERRSSVEGVKLDDELVKMTQYQQSYAAASRVIQAAKDMWDILLSIK